MTDTLPVHLNREELHSLSVPASFETSDSFVIAVQNHGEAARVHVHLDDGLSEVASVEATNHYVRANETAEIPVAVHETGVFGKLKVVSGYGAVTRWVDVRLTEPEDDGVVVDEDLGTPQPRPDDGRETGPGSGSGLAGALADRPAAPVALLGGVALVVALGAALTFGSAAVAVGAAVVVVAVLAAALLVLTG